MDIKEKTSDPTINIVLDTLEKKKQAIIFANTKNSAEKTAEEIARKMKDTSPAYAVLAERALRALSRPTKQCERLAACLKKGIAFHHAGLTMKQKDLIEENFKNRTIKVIAATPTLAVGVDLPAYRVIIKDPRRYGMRGLQFIPVLEYMQMSGRAGRPKFDDAGEAILISSSDGQKKELTERYVNGSPEPIFSKLAVEPVLRTYLLSLISANIFNSRKDIYDFFSRTFWAFQFADTQKLNSIIDRMLLQLDEWEFISSSKEDFVSASDLDDESFKATILGKRVAELYLDPYTAHFLVELIPKAFKKHTPFSVLHAVSGTLEMRPQLRARVKDYEKIQAALLEQYLLVDEPSLYDDDYESFSNAVKTALFMQDWIDEKDEEFLLEEYSIRPGEIRVKLDLADWLVYCMEEMTRILNFKQLLPSLKKLRVRIQNGVKEEIIPLLRFRNIGRVRARKLFLNGIKDVKDVREADLTSLAQILGKNIAIDVKKQLGDNYEAVPENKRKGQINLNDYE